MSDALPIEPEEFFRLQRLCLRIYGLLSRDVPAQAQALARAAAPSLRKKQLQNLTQALLEELPVFMALYALDRLSDDERLQGEGADEVVRGMLLPCFSLSYQHLYEEPADPLKHVLARVDWYLDGDKGEPREAFFHWLNMLMDEKLGNGQPFFQYLDKNFLPELDSRFQLAFRYEYGIE